MNYVAIRYYFLGFLTFALVIIFLLHSVFYNKDKNKYYVYKAEFSSLENLEVGNDVMMYGYEIGKVKKIYLTKNYIPVVQIYIDKNIKITDDSSLSIKELNFMGSKILQLNIGISDYILHNYDYIYNTNVGISTIEIINKLLIPYLSNKMLSK